MAGAETATAAMPHSSEVNSDLVNFASLTCQPPRSRAV
jgi:hypothetical protein